MIPEDYAEFCKTLNGCCESVGKPIVSKAGADIFYMRLSAYELPMVQWALLEATVDCKSGFDYTVNRITAIIDKHVKKNQFRENAVLMLEQQQQDNIIRDRYLKSDEFEQNLAKAKNCFDELKAGK